MMFLLPIGIVMILGAVILAVYALSKPEQRDRTGSLTTAWAHFLNEGDQITVPRDGDCVVTEVVSTTTVRYRPLRHG